MDRILSVLASVLSNILALFSGLDADEIRENINNHTGHAMQAARVAAAERQVELEKELAEMTEKRS